MFWICKDKKIEYGKRTLIMGIVNITPDSFSDGGDYYSTEGAVKHALELIEDGADIIDLGAQSTRPGAKIITPEEEWSRLEGVLKALGGKISVPISVDTFYPEVAEKAVKAGADIINDVSGTVSKEMAKIVKESACGWIIMHNASASPKEVGEFFQHSLCECSALGINKEQLCFDMGIGFGKDYEENLRLLACVEEYKVDGVALLLGVSRKRVIAQASEQNNPKERIYGNIAADTAAILGGADIIRLHDVKNEKQGILTADAIKNIKLKG